MNILFISSFLLSMVTITLAAPLTDYCHTEYKIIWKNEYVEKEEYKCQTVYEEWCSEVCKPHESKYCEPHKEEKCTWEKKTECQDVHKKIHVPYTETECKKKQKKVCDHQWQGTGKDKVWAEIPDTCKFVYDDHCEDVTKHREKETTEKVCEEVPKKYCHYVETELCKTITSQKCEPYCTKKPKEHCEKVHKKTPIRVSKKIPHTVCTSSGNNCDELCEGLENCFKNVDGRCCGDDPNTNEQVCRGAGGVPSDSTGSGGGTGSGPRNGNGADTGNGGDNLDSINVIMSLGNNDGNGGNVGNSDNDNNDNDYDSLSEFS